MKPIKPENCESCDRSKELTFHHLVPKKMHTKYIAKTLHSDRDLLHYGVWLCIDCHKKIHRLFSHADLAKEYYTLERLLANEDFNKFVSWVAKQQKKIKFKGWYGAKKK